VHEGRSGAFLPLAVRPYSAPMSPAEGASDSGLTVEQYAGISAAIADGYPLDAVLANEGLAPKAWPEADTTWKQRLVGDPATFESYRARLGEAEDWLGRKVTPLDDDLAAWMGFLGAYGAHTAPFDLLGGLGLGTGDLGRLQRRWQKRLASDEELAKQAAELAKKKPSAVGLGHRSALALATCPPRPGRAPIPSPARADRASLRPEIAAPGTPPPCARCRASRCRGVARAYAAPSSKLSCPVGSRALPRGSGSVLTPRWDRIFFTTAGSMMVAITRIFPAHRGHRIASTP